MKASEETRKRQSEAAIKRTDVIRCKTCGRIKGSEHICVTKHSEETKKKISLSLMGNQYAKGKTNFRGKTHTEETKKKIRLKKIGGKASAATKLKMGNARTGEKNGNWVKDRTKIKQYWTERNNPEYKQWRKSVLKRDNLKCRMSNCDCTGKVIAHHILSWSAHPELRYDLNNGIALCHFHHPRKRAEEIKLSTHFKQLIAI